MVRGYGKKNKIKRDKKKKKETKGKAALDTTIKAVVLSTPFSSLI